MSATSSKAAFRTLGDAANLRDNDGAMLRRPAKEALCTYEVREEGGKIQVRV